MENSQEKSSERILEIQAQVSQIQKSLKGIEEKLKKPAAGQSGLWVERLMYWLIVVALIIAVIKVA
jgi:Flp pilus assembly protein TadB